jgi:hypothetical protein
MIVDGTIATAVTIATTAAIRIAAGTGMTADIVATVAANQGEPQGLFWAA